jgi:fructose-bisphosphate aldolase class II
VDGVIVSAADVIRVAAKESRGVGAFNVIQLEHAEAIVAGAETAGLPVILQISENTVRYHGRLEPLALATIAIGRSAAVPVVVHLDHVTEAALVREAVGLGIGSVMFDGSRLSYVDNLAATAEVARYCRERGVFVEAELGEVGGKDGVHSPGARTDPFEANRFVAATGVDALAVAVGTSHAMRSRDAAVDLELIARLRASVPVPLVLHGSSGVPDDDLVRAVATGMSKVNIATRLNDAFTAAVRGYLTAHPGIVDPRTYLRAARDGVASEVVRMLTLLNR